MSLTPDGMAKLQSAERMVFAVAARQVARGETPGLNTTAGLLLTIERLVTEPPKELVAEGTGPLLDPDCRDGKCGSCIGAPCEHECHRAGVPLIDPKTIAAEVAADVHRLTGGANGGRR